MVRVHLGPPPAQHGDLAQLVEHCLCKAGVRGSIPLVSTQVTLLRTHLQKRKGSQNDNSNTAHNYGRHCC